MNPTLEEVLCIPDVYAAITEVDPATVEQVANAMEVTATDPQH